MGSKQVLLELLREAESALAYAASHRIAAMHEGKYVLGTDESIFDPVFHAHSGRAHHEVLPRAHDEWNDHWNGPDEHSTRSLVVGWLEIRWEGHVLEVVRLPYQEGFQKKIIHFVIAENDRIARAYFDEVCAHCAEVRDEILVFANGCWNKNKELYASVRRTSFADVVLADGLAERIQRDFDQFLAAREQYEKWAIPWKRGALFVGPPGNGKTMCIKALIGHLGLPCLYVQSFVAPRQPEQVAIREVFQRARRTAPCLMVLEDLDSLVTPEGRSFFLNELDGFAANEGIVTIGSTNHPERLDPAIVDRPSRFDRKYHFLLPGEIERRRYVASWNERLTVDLRLDTRGIDEIAAKTDAFSFAYLKELFAAGLMRFASGEQGELLSVLLAEADALGAQMQSAQLIPDVNDATVPTEVDPFAMSMRRRKR